MVLKHVSVCNLTKLNGLSNMIVQAMWVLRIMHETLVDGVQGRNLTEMCYIIESYKQKPCILQV